MSTWETTSGGIEEFEGTVKEAYFAPNARYQNGEVLLLNLVFDAAEAGTEEDYTQLYPMGKGWESTDGGKTAQDAGGKADRKINKQSAFGTLIDRLAKPESDGGLGLAQTLADRGPALEARTWEGLRFHWKMETQTYDINGEKRSSTRLMPVAFLGEGAEGSVQNSNTGDNATGELRAQLREMAQGAESEEAFRNAAVVTPGVTEDAALLDEVISGRFYAEVKG